MVMLAVVFVNHILTKERNSAEKYLEQSVLQTASNLKGRISSSISELNVLSAKLAANVHQYNDDEISNFLLAHIADYDFHRLTFAYPDGRTVRFQKDTGKLESVNWSSDERFLRAISGSSVFACSPPHSSQRNNCHNCRPKKAPPDAPPLAGDSPPEYKAVCFSDQAHSIQPGCQTYSLKE